jgi:hypothetical protein
MPLLGFFGFPPFALELFAMYHLVMGAWRSLGAGERARTTWKAIA